MKVTFYKYQGTGNDFILIDNRDGVIDNISKDKIKYFCDRRFGIGADGFILLEKDNSADFKMVYFNADGAESTMCGNGGRCIASFAHYLGIVDDKFVFNAIDGLHDAEIKEGLIHLKMKDVHTVNTNESYSFLDTGSPHHVEFVKSGLDKLNVKDEGSIIRYSDLYGQEGSNINFVTNISENSLKVRTYERGVEDETLSCGTGVTAAAIAAHKKNLIKNNVIKVSTLGGELQISFNERDGVYKNVWLIGPAEQVYKGEIKW